MDTADHCLDLVRRFDTDRYLAALFAPEAARPALLALAAFGIEIARVRESVREVLPGEIRLQWWRDTLEHRQPSGHPVADALLEAIARYSLPVPALIGVIDAHTFDLYDDAMPDLNELEGYAGETAGALIQLGAIVLAGGRDPGTGTLAGHAGAALTLCRVVQGLPRASARGQLFLPGDVLARHGADPAAVRAGTDSPALRAALGEMIAHARHHLDRVGPIGRAVPPAAVPAFLPLSGTLPLLNRLQTSRTDPLHTITEMPALPRLWRMWRFAAQGRRRLKRTGGPDGQAQG